MRKLVAVSNEKMMHFIKKKKNQNCHNDTCVWSQCRAGRLNSYSSRFWFHKKWLNN